MTSGIVTTLFAGCNAGDSAELSSMLPVPDIQTAVCKVFLNRL